MQELVEEFENLSKGRGNGSMKAGQANMARNRYIDVLPYDHNAVVLPGALLTNRVCLPRLEADVGSCCGLLKVGCISCDACLAAFGLLKVGLHFCHSNACLAAFSIIMQGSRSLALVCCFLRGCAGWVFVMLRVEAGLPLCRPPRPSGCSWYQLTR